MFIHNIQELMRQADQAEAKVGVAVEKVQLLETVVPTSRQPELEQQKSSSKQQLEAFLQSVKSTQYVTACF